MKTFQILPAEFVGDARHDIDGVLTIGCPDDHGQGVVKIRLQKGHRPGWWNTGTVQVYVRRLAHDLSIAEIHIAQHDGLFAEELDTQNAEAERYPLGPKEYWRSKFLHEGNTEEEFEEFWDDGDEEFWDDGDEEFWDDDEE